MKIFVKVSFVCLDTSRDAYSLEVKSNDLIQTVKQMTIDKVYSAGLPPGFRLVMTSGSTVLDVEKTLSYYNIMVGASIHATIDDSAGIDLNLAVVVIHSDLDESRGHHEFEIHVKKSTKFHKICFAAAKVMGVVDGAYNSLCFLIDGKRIAPHATCKMIDNEENRFEVDVIWKQPQEYKLVGGKVFRRDLELKIEEGKNAQNVQRAILQMSQKEHMIVKDSDELSSLSAGSDFDHEADYTTPATTGTALRLYNPLTQDAALKAKLKEHTTSLQMKAIDLQHGIQLDQQRLAMLLKEARDVRHSLALLQYQARENRASLNAAKQHEVNMQAAANAIALVDRQKRELLEYLDKEASSQLQKKARN